MKIGYACLNLSVPGPGFKACRLKNLSSELLHSIITHNLNYLKTILLYNIKNKINLFRISSDVIPLGSHPVNRLMWWISHKNELDELKCIIQKNKIRVSMHPGQYTVLNSPDRSVRLKAVADLKYHYRFLHAVAPGREHKMILHIGGVYGDKTSAKKRFVSAYKRLDPEIKKKLVIENDHRSYNVSDVLKISDLTGIPVVYDDLHHILLPSVGKKNWPVVCAETWKKTDGPPKMHFSVQSKKGRKGAHSETIRPHEFFPFYLKVRNADPDIMLEVKDKNISAERAIALLGKKKRVFDQEWAAYKYPVMERSYRDYKALSMMINQVDTDPAEFFGRIGLVLKNLPELKQEMNTMQHVWGYFKSIAESNEKDRFFYLLKEFKIYSERREELKAFLYRLAVKYKKQYLLDSYYFEF